MIGDGRSKTIKSGNVIADKMQPTCTCILFRFSKKDHIIGIPIWLPFQVHNIYTAGYFHILQKL